MKLHHTAPALLLLAATGCTPLQMRPPATPFDQTEEAVLHGIDWQEAGSFTLAGSSGRYARGAGYDWFGDVMELRGGAGFVAAGDGITGELSAACNSSATDMGSGALTIRTRNIAYRCRFARDRHPIPARLVLDERTALLDRREGHIELGGARIELRSEHHMLGSSVPVAKPLGYVFSANGQAIGGIDLNGSAKRVFLPRDPALREAALAAALALALFIDAEVGEVAD
ncbi:hypothetical protein P6144_17670 [Sphingomonas sp. HITSZ_GF]|uniref:hypothetical protein n=1 Tax=Sphingomonas sp. HITSZ_GF TaxID=3037247 RepID=UPI00240D11B0|nr:hypothetical protein [Sphingomonas sp. HITSZ_GF]MDG2535495.1 hypothetical protein [Sphingomonas sp. HITSZ_GF]